MYCINIFQMKYNNEVGKQFQGMLVTNDKNGLVVVNTGIINKSSPFDTITEYFIKPIIKKSKDSISITDYEKFMKKVKLNVTILNNISELKRIFKQSKSF